MSLSTFTLLHVLISLAGIGSGLIVVYGMLTRNRMNGITTFFLAMTILMDLTGYLFPVEHILPSHIVGAISLARWRSHRWRATAAAWKVPGAGSTW